MAFNLATFKTRSLTAVIFVIVMVAGLVVNKWSFYLLFTIIHFGCWIEYVKLVSLIDKEYTFFSIRPKSIGHNIFGLIYISLSCILMMYLYDYSFSVPAKNIPFSKEPFAHLHAAFPWFVPAFIIACMWINDTMAYIVGSLIGKTPFSSISPKKTWEGTIGGIILCILVAGYIGDHTNQLGIKSVVHVPAYHWYVMAGIAAIAGTAGDLLESKLKRLAGVKDSGHIMPGHGGFLDRFDSLLVATPFVWLYLQLAL
jgi:phosphatidate cytidylyltransferase